MAARASRRQRDYFPSYSCRKLVRLGLVSSSQATGNGAWATRNVAKAHVDAAAESLLAKAAVPRALAARESPGGEYIAELRWEQNLFRVFALQHVARGPALTAKELARRLGAESRQRFLKRSLLRFVAADVLAAATRNVGKCFYREFRLSERFAARNAALVAAYAPSARRMPRGLRPTRGRGAAALVRAARAAVFNAGEVYAQTLRPSALCRVARLLSSADGEVRLLLARRRLDELAAMLARGDSLALCDGDLAFVSSALFALTIARRNDLANRTPPKEKNEQKLLSAERLEKMIFLLNELDQRDRLTLHESVRLLNARFGVGNRPKTDRRTVERMSGELARLGLAKVRRFRVEFGRGQSLRRTLIIGADCALSEAEIAQNAYIAAPTNLLCFPQNADVAAQLEHAARVGSFLAATHRRFLAFFLRALVANFLAAAAAERAERSARPRTARLCADAFDALVTRFPAPPFALQSVERTPRAAPLRALLACMRLDERANDRIMRSLRESLAPRLPISLDALFGGEATRRAALGFALDALVARGEAALGSLYGQSVAALI